MSWPQPHSKAMVSKQASLRVQSQVEQLLQLRHGIFWFCDCMSNRPWVIVDLVVVSTRGTFVAKEMNRRIFNAAGLLRLVLKVPEAECLVPALGKDIEGDLAANRVAILNLVFASRTGVVYSTRERGASTHVNPKSANFSFNTATNFSRTLCSRSYLL